MLFCHTSQCSGSLPNSGTRSEQFIPHSQMKVYINTHGLHVLTSIKRIQIIPFYFPSSIITYMLKAVKNNNWHFAFKLLAEKYTIFLEAWSQFYNSHQQPSSYYPEVHTLGSLRYMYMSSHTEVWELKYINQTFHCKECQWSLIPVIII